MAIVYELRAIAKKKGVALARLCIAWVDVLGEHVVPVPSSSFVLPSFGSAVWACT
ncbi:hypothetical protein AcW1_004165 [Taiwanofungus camphoratus]|nr:hypothetical protein AcW1_004165 [Antrodia cinnamomea]